MTGLKFGRLTAVRMIGASKGKRPRWECICDCGNTHVAEGSKLKYGDATSCGCKRREAAKQLNTTHGKSRSKAYVSWLNAKQRTLNPKNPNYAHYGGRGVPMHPDWVNDFQSFLQYMGEPPRDDMTLERINNDKGYEPGNVVWATREAQARNRRCVLLSVELAAAAREYAAKGTPRKDIANLMNVSKSVIEKVIMGKTWKRGFANHDQNHSRQSPD